MPKSRAADILFSHEKKPRGTAGAIKHTAEAIKSNPFLVLNGDTFLRVDYSKFISFHLKKRALLSLVLTSCAKMSDSGSVAIREDGRVRDFREKVKNKPGLRLSNAGIYLLDKRILSFIPAGKKSSLEYEVLPEILNQRVFGFISKDKFLDIGTPKNYRLAQILLSGRVFAGGKGKK
jgi:NDP-sugar pyrophosphorylase family protein